MSPRWLAAMALLVSTTAIADESKSDKQPAPAQQPGAVSVTCDWFEIWATHGKGVVDPSIPKKVANKLGNSIKQNDYKLLSSGKVTLEPKKAQTPKLTKGTATITLVETVNKAQVRLTTAFTAANKTNNTTTELVSAGDWIAKSMNQSNAKDAEAHVFTVGDCK